MLSGRVAMRYGDRGLDPDTIYIRFEGTAGQSFGAFLAAGITIDWFGEGHDEVGVERGTDRVRIRIDPQLFRPSDAPLLVGDASRARRELGFAPSLDTAGLAQRMVDADLARERRAIAGDAR
jgi:GDP-D-mannose dehydratase